MRTKVHLFNFYIPKHIPKIPLFILLINIFKYIIIDTAISIKQYVQYCNYKYNLCLYSYIKSKQAKKNYTYSMIGNTGFVLFSVSDLSAKSLSAAFYFLIFYL